MESIGDPVEIRRSLKWLRSEGLLDYAADAQGMPLGAFITVHRPVEEIPAHCESWKALLEESSLSAEERYCLANLGAPLEGMNSADLQSLLDGLVRLRAEQHLHAGHLAFRVSAAYLLGSSKLLSSIDSRLLKGFGIDVGLFLSRPPYLVVSVPDDISAVVLIENPVAFEAAIQSDARDRCAFVCTFGFGLSNTSSEYGFQLAGVIETGNAILLHRYGGCNVTLSELLQANNVYFWGDLDIAGLQIYERLAKRIPTLQLSGVYEPMISSLRKSGNSHPYVAAVGKLGQPSSVSSFARSESRELFALCENRGVDQETVSISQIGKLAGLPLQHF